MRTFFETSAVVACALKLPKDVWDSFSLAEQRKFINEHGTLVIPEKLAKNSHPVLRKWRQVVRAFLRAEERRNRITPAAHPPITQTPDFWRLQEQRRLRLRHFDLLDEPRRFGFFRGLPLVGVSR
jgi:hypothetical protein